ncbi:hypothetical protein PV08_10603 [Exophiala spinifera]|uniref:Uncharacterized protein n=1 Tax=Exophiala spinifera TaxID=91928 RepID=A0A0D2AX62_9EURO|nr:uncharacterized protein PV08_10603 [Exophiala spinifera]KIW11303.1 hypothetical protein PV08_10603 [Exophiala spinifera]
MASRYCKALAEHGRPDNKRSDIVETYLQQIEDVQLGRRKFSAEYLESRELLEYWDLVQAMYREFFNDHPSYTEVGGGKLNELEIFEKDVEQLTTTLLAAVNSGSLNHDGRVTIRRRWSILDRLMQEHYSRTNTKRTSLSWSDIASQFREARSPNESKELNVDWTSTCMWLTFTATVIVALPTFALAFQYSPHARGSTLDADFWFLLQSCSMQFLGFLTVGIPMWKGKLLSVHVWYWTWGFIGLAMSCTLAAPFIYCKLRTEWSAFLVIVAGTIQAFVTLQITLIANHSL